MLGLARAWEIVRESRDQLPGATPTDRDAGSIGELDLEPIANAPRRSYAIEVHDSRTVNASKAAA